METTLKNSDTAKHLIIINVLVYVVVNFVPGMKEIGNTLAMYYVDSPLFKPWQLLTHMFMHADFATNGFWHILMNMYVLYLFGRILERVWGSKRFVFYYFASGIGAACIYLLMEGIGFKLDPQFGTFFPFTEGLPVKSIPVVGASGAVFGVTAAFAVLFPNTELRLLFIPFPIKAKYLIGGYVAVELFLGLASLSSAAQTGGIAHFAHVGGALIGFLIVKFWQRSSSSFY